MRSLSDAACWIRSLRQLMVKMGQLVVRQEKAEEGGEAVLREHWACIFECSAW